MRLVFKLYARHLTPFRSAAELIGLVLNIPCGGQATLYSTLIPCFARARLGRGLRDIPQLLRSQIAGRQEGNRINAVYGIFVREAGNDDFTNLGLPTLYGALDFVGLEQRNSPSCTAIFSFPALPARLPLRIAGCFRYGNYSMDSQSAYPISAGHKRLGHRTAWPKRRQAQRVWATYGSPN